VESFDCLFLRQSPKKSGTPQRFYKNRALYLRILMLHLGFRGYVAYSTRPTGAPSRLRHSKGLLKIKSVLGAFGSVWERKNPLGDKGSWLRIPPLRTFGCAE
jgi:hypothetical protein